VPWHASKAAQAAALRNLVAAALLLIAELHSLTTSSSKRSNVLLPQEISDLAAHGVESTARVADHRYLNHAAVDALEGDPRVKKSLRVRRVEKIASSAYAKRERAGVLDRSPDISSTMSLSTMHSERFTDAGGIIVAVDVRFELPPSSWSRGFLRHQHHSLLKTIASSDLRSSAPFRRQTTPSRRSCARHALFSAPYNLSGNGVVRRFSSGAVDTTHPEFGGRVTSHLSGSATGGNSITATHVSGTITASGLNARPKGCSLRDLHDINALDDIAVMLDKKQNMLPSLSVLADNNSWVIRWGWQPNQSAAVPPGLVGK